jgi:hypothetical protein
MNEFDKLQSGEQMISPMRKFKQYNYAYISYIKCQN